MNFSIKRNEIKLTEEIDRRKTYYYYPPHVELLIIKYDILVVGGKIIII